MDKTEIWKDVCGFEGLYQVSNLGKVRSLDRLVNSGIGIGLRKGRVLKPQMTIRGYLQVGLNKDGKQKLFSVHRLVWTAFNGKRPEGMQVNHIDEDKTNNRLDNLNLMTPKENTNWGTGNERRAKSMINHKSLSKPIIQYNLTGEKLAEFEGLHDAARKLNINQGNISSALNGRYKTAGGFKWKYKTSSPLPNVI